MQEVWRSTGHRAKETVKLPEGDRIYTVTEGKGITGALCGGRECEKNVRKTETYRRARRRNEFLSDWLAKQAERTLPLHSRGLSSAAAMSLVVHCPMTVLHLCC
jgi:hypothetical protein